VYFGRVWGARKFIEHKKRGRRENKKRTGGDRKVCLPKKKACKLSRLVAGENRLEGVFGEKARLGMAIRPRTRLGRGQISSKNGRRYSRGGEKLSPGGSKKTVQKIVGGVLEREWSGVEGHPIDKGNKSFQKTTKSGGPAFYC